MISEKVEFAGEHGMLAARLDRPAGGARAYALFAHCFTCTKDIHAARHIAEGLASAGIGVLRFDFSGLGHSEGDFANTNFTSNVEDLIHAAKHMRETDRSASLLVGHSLGGAAVLQAAPRLAEAKAVATIGAPYDPGHVAHHFEGHIHEIEKAGEAEVELAGRRFRVKKQFLEDIRSQSIADAVAGLRKALLVLHAPLDETVGIRNATEIFTAAKHPKSFVSLDDADHLLRRRADALYAARVIAAWASRYLGLVPAQKPQTRLAAKAGETLVIEQGTGKFAQYIEANGHVLAADEPRAQGGDDGGPSPYDLLLAALGACTAMTLRLYADHKKLPLTRTAVRLSHEKIHAADCADCEDKDARIDLIEREIELVGELDEKTRERLLQIADKCPVHRTLTGPVRIKSRLNN
ncbi:MAG: OsmC family protein [Alphaproteobacteria bacterium]|nr:MAG: OsmC family protein [Alphaproteobacteria bacterium]